MLTLPDQGGWEECGGFGRAFRGFKTAVWDTYHISSERLLMRIQEPSPHSIADLEKIKDEFGYAQKELPVPTLQSQIASVLTEKKSLPLHPGVLSARLKQEERHAMRSSRSLNAQHHCSALPLNMDKIKIRLQLLHFSPNNRCVTADCQNRCPSQTSLHCTTGQRTRGPTIPGSSLLYKS